MKRPSHSKKWPLSLVVSGIFLLTMNALIIVGMMSLSKTARNKEIESLVSNTSTLSYILANQIINNGLDSYEETENVSDQKDKISELEYMAAEISGRIIVVNREYVIIEDTYHQKEGQYYMTSDMINLMTKGTTSHQKIGNSYMQLIQAVTDQESGEVLGAVVTIASLQDVNSQSSYLSMQKNILFGIFFLVTLSIAIFVLLIIRNPFTKLKGELDSLVAGHSDTHISDSRFAEFSKIADAINEISEKNQELEETRQEFVSNVSHELKTPITSMKILADSLVGQENVPIEIYQEFMEDIVHEVDRENQIIVDLLELVKMDKRKADLNIESTNINELLEELMRRILPIAEKRSIQMRLETMRNVTAEVDRGKLSMALTNLIENAVKYNVDEGQVKVSLNADHKFFYIRVKDTGVGIPPEFQERIFERFYRVDKARSRDTGGTGLGLAITRNIVLLHKGSIKVHSTEGKGSVFIVRIPLNYV